MSKTKEYIEAGLPLCPGGGINEYQYQKHIGGGLFSQKDPTWVHLGKVGKYHRENGYHKCCGSKRSYRHLVGCKTMKALVSDDLSDLKDV